MACIFNFMNKSLITNSIHSKKVPVTFKGTNFINDLLLLNHKSSFVRLSIAVFLEKLEDLITQNEN